MNALVKALKREFIESKEYRHAYADDFLNSSIATQIKVLREQRELRQIDLARVADMKQSMISRLENVNYSSWSIKTLKRLAEAFDVVLTVKFERFKDLVLDADRFSRKSLEVPNFENDPFFSHSAGYQSSTSSTAISESYETVAATSQEEEMMIAAVDPVLAAQETARNVQIQVSVGVSK